MSTVPTSFIETIAATDPTEVTGAASGLESIKEIMDSFDPATLLPDLTTVVGKVAFISRVAVLAGPIVLLVLGLAYLFLSPKEANHYFGYRCYYGMGSVEAWRFTQRLAGIVWGALGLVLTVVMFFATGGFAGMEVMDMVWKAVVCLLWEIGLTVLSCVAINVTVMTQFDAKGEHRKKK